VLVAEGAIWKVTVRESSIQDLLSTDFWIAGNATSK
jgi:hypothetical protein